MLRGIDVSHYQGNVDWAALKHSYGIVWGAAKATEADKAKTNIESAVMIPSRRICSVFPPCSPEWVSCLRELTRRAERARTLRR